MPKQRYKTYTETPKKVYKPIPILKDPMLIIHQQQINRNKHILQTVPTLTLTKNKHKIYNKQPS